MPRVGSKHSIVCTPPATQRAIVTFCWLPPDRRRTSPPARESIWSLRDRGVDLRRLSPEVDRAPAPEAGRRRQRDVLADRALHQQRLGAVGGHVDDAGQDRVGRVAEGHRRAIHEQLSAARTGGAGEDVEQLVLALALERGDAQDLARIEVERDVLEPRPVGEAAHGQAGLARWPPAAGPSCAPRPPAAGRRSRRASARRSGPPSPRSRRRRRPSRPRAARSPGRRWRRSRSSGGR